MHHTVHTRADVRGHFGSRHIGPSADEQAAMLAALGFDSLDDLMRAAVPGGIRTGAELALPAAASEEQAARELRAIAGRNTPREPMIGLSEAEAEGQLALKQFLRRELYAHPHVEKMTRRAQATISGKSRDDFMAKVRRLRQSTAAAGRQSRRAAQPPSECSLM